MQSPDGLDTKHDSAVPVAVVPDGHDVAIVTYVSSMATYPLGHDVDGAAAYAPPTTKNQDKNIKYFIHTPILFMKKNNIGQF